MKIINYDTGIVTEEEILPGLFEEPVCAKIYIDDLASILELPAGIRGLLFELTQRINYNGIILLRRTIKNEIAEKLKITIGTFDNYLTKLVKVGILKRVGRGKFEANPYLFIRQDWAEINSRYENLEISLRMTITYLASGERRIEGTVIK